MIERTEIAESAACITFHFHFVARRRYVGDGNFDVDGDDDQTIPSESTSSSGYVTRKWPSRTFSFSREKRNSLRDNDDNNDEAKDAPSAILDVNPEVVARRAVGLVHAYTRSISSIILQMRAYYASALCDRPTRIDINRRAFPPGPVRPVVELSRSIGRGRRDDCRPHAKRDATRSCRIFSY